MMSPDNDGAGVILHPQDSHHVLEGLKEAARGEGVTLTREQLERWAATGEWPWEGDTGTSGG